LQLLIKHSNFEPNIFGHGGDKRTAQLEELVKSAGVSIVNIEPLRQNSFYNYLYIPKGLAFLLKNKFSFTLRKQVLSNTCKTLRKAEVAFNNIDSNGIFLWESTRGYNYILPYVAKNRGLKVIGVPHNIESLVQEQTYVFTNQKCPDWFFQEIKHLKLADKIFCISREDQWLLNLHGINADFLPYLPPIELRNRLRYIREKRKSLSPKKYLLLGSFGNKPTKKGVIELIKFINENAILNRVNFDIVGYKSNLLKNYAVKNINIHGSVGQDQLEKFLLETRAAIIFQEVSTGALTRIAEFLVCGIPVIANFKAARSYFNIKGIYVFEDLNQLPKLIEKEFDIPKVPSEFYDHEQRFIDYLKAITHN
jgi:glycosyltransferase involved in cell wall biosynthesis